jgi:hypothetical protein
MIFLNGNYVQQSINSIIPHNMTFFKHFTIFILLLFILATPTSAQDPTFTVYGSVKDDSTKQKLENAQLIVLKDGKKLETILCPSGKYSLDLPLDYEYTFIFKAKGYVQKIILVDTRNISPEDTTGGFELNLDINLIGSVKGYNKKLNKLPIGKAVYDPTLNDIVFDIPYTKGRQAIIQAEIQRLRSKKKKN